MVVNMTFSERSFRTKLFAWEYKSSICCCC